MQRTWIALVLTAGLAACAPRGASAPENIDKLSVTEANIQTAHDAGGDQDPRASRYLSRARQQVADAKVRSKNGDHAGARILIDRASLDAELAVEVTRETTMRRQADANQQIRVEHVEEDVTP